MNNVDFPDFDDFCSSFDTNNNIENNDNNGTNNNSSSSFNGANFFSGIDINTIMKMKNIMDKMNSQNNNPRSNLLLSLKPYLKSSRQDKIDQYIKLMNMSTIFESFNTMGGEKTK